MHELSLNKDKIMGFRFRKSINLGCGVRMNFSKSGVGLSVGGKFGRVSMGPKGTRVTTRIPGTGISMTQKVGGGKQKRAKSTSAKTYDATTTRASASRSNTLYDQAAYEHNAQIAAESNQRNQTFLDIHKHSAQVRAKHAYELRLKGLKKETYIKVPFVEPQPTVETVNEELSREADTQISTLMFWKVNQLKNEYVTSRFQQRMNQRLNEWEQRRAAYEANQNAIENQENARLAQEYEERLSFLQAQIQGDQDFIEDQAEIWLAECSLPVDIDAQFQFTPESKALFLDLDLPEVEDMPTDYLVQLKNGELRERSKTQTDIRKDYAQCVFGLCVYAASHMFDISPEVEHVILSAYTQRRDKIGNLQDDYIFSVKFIRDGFNGISFEDIDPEEFCMKFENRCLATKTKIFKAIEPYGEKDI